MKLHLAGDTVVDWIIKGREIIPEAGGVGNVARGLFSKGIDNEVTTLYNPTTPVDYLLKLKPNSIQDFNYTDVYIRDYNNHVFKRYRSGLRPKTFTLKGVDVVVAHKDSCIREFSSFYADVREPDIKGECEILRMSGTDDYMSIMERVKWRTAIITHKDEVSVHHSNGEHYGLQYGKVEAVDDIGAGDCFNVGFLTSHYKNPTFGILDHVRAGLYEAQEKVQKVGVFFE